MTQVGPVDIAALSAQCPYLAVAPPGDPGGEDEQMNGDDRQMAGSGSAAKTAMTAPLRRNQDRSGQNRSR